MSENVPICTWCNKPIVNYEESRQFWNEETDSWDCFHLIGCTGAYIKSLKQTIRDLLNCEVCGGMGEYWKPDEIHGNIGHGRDVDCLTRRGW